MYDPKRVSRAARVRIADIEARGQPLGIADITLFEAADVARKGRVKIDGSVAAWLNEALAQSAVSVERLTPSIAATAAGLAWPNAEAFDRIIVATAKYLGVPLITADSAIIDAKPVEVIW